ncbi:hypothetical protein AWB75_05408 [Caballeronia catudaia]|uniref:Uncharacterized protein n=2 Tax=Caballeronia catudaia TaxID=1777136 RepID=A0A158CMA4_9BURK|nr:hypothetical protein AWB75_05408 [Caballeronia catudaia]
MLGAVLVVGCVHVDQKSLPKDSVATLSGKRIDFTEYEKSSFSAMTAGKVMFGLLGVPAMIAAGNQIVKENNIEDPSIRISQELTNRLVTQHGMQKAQHRSELAESDDLASLLRNRADIDFLLDVKTINWSFTYFPSNWTHYRVLYTARMRLIDTAQQQVVAETLCHTRPVDETNPPTRDELLSDNAKMLRTFLEKAADDCTSVLSKDFLQL